MRVNSLYLFVLASFLSAASLFVGCDKSLGFHNEPPEISSIIRSSCYVGTEGFLELECVAEDPDEDAISVRWSTTAGGFFPSSGEGASVIWETPGEPGTYTVTAIVTDDIDESSMDIEIEVGQEIDIAPSGNTVLSNDIPYYVISAAAMVIVLEGATVTVESGVTVVVNYREGGLSVRGSIEINGTEEDPVYFKPNICPGEEGIWTGIAFTGANSTGSLRNVNIAMASDAISVVGGGTVSIDSCFIHDGAGTAVFTDHSVISINESRVSDNSSGIHTVTSDVEITGCEIRDNSAYGIWLAENESGGEDPREVTIEGCEVATNYYDGIIISWRALPVINYNAIHHNGMYSGGYDIRLSDYREDAEIDARHNYWGVTTENEIQAVIFDSEDFGLPHAYVDFSDWLMSQP